MSAVTSHAIHKLEIEDYAHVTLRTPSGIVFLNEASYTFPGTGSDQERKLSAEKVFLRATTTGGEGVQIIGPGRNETVKAPEGYLSGWPRVVNECLDRIGRGEPPPATAARLRACRVVDFRRLQNGGREVASHASFSGLEPRVNPKPRRSIEWEFVLRVFVAHCASQMGRMGPAGC